MTTALAIPSASVRLPFTFTEAFPALHEASYRAAFRLLGDREEAEDIAQEACTRACVRWRRVQSLSSPPAWVARVSTNLAIDRWRRLQRTDRNAVPERAAVSELDRRRVDLTRALASLPTRQRDVVVLRYVIDLTEQETADALECAVGTVKSHASRGLATLRAALTERETA